MPWELSLLFRHLGLFLETVKWPQIVKIWVNITHRFNSSLKITSLSEWCAKEKLMRVRGTHEKFTASTPAQRVFSAMKLRGCKGSETSACCSWETHQPYPWLCPPSWPSGESVKAMVLRQWPLVLTKVLPGMVARKVWSSLFNAAWVQGCGQWLWTWVVPEGCTFWNTGHLYRLSISWLGPKSWDQSLPQ